LLAPAVADWTRGSRTREGQGGGREEKRKGKLGSPKFFKLLDKFLIVSIKVKP